jgi:hypothetical protein
VLENERPAFFHVATHAGFKACFLEQRLVQRAVGIVAIGALHQPFRYPVVSGQCKLRLNGRMTGVTKPGCDF